MRTDQIRTAAAVGDFFLEPVFTAKRDVHASLVAEGDDKLRFLVQIM